MSKFGRIGDVTKVDNTDRKFGAAPFYYAIRVEIDGVETAILLTEHELSSGLDRAANNPEDCPKATTFLDMLRDAVD